MARLEDSVDNERRHLEALECPEFENAAFAPPRRLADCHVALLSTAGLMERHSRNVQSNASDYRTITSAVADADILLNHVSVNFDRSAFVEDINSVLPRQRLQELAQQNIIAKAASEHYSFMGATAPELMEDDVHRLAAELKSKGVNTVCLLPV